MRGTPQDSQFHLLLEYATGMLKGTLYSPSVHAAVLQPRRLAAWLEGAATIPGECVRLIDRIPMLLTHRRPPLGVLPTVEAPGLVTAAQWKEGAVQLQREVCVCVCVCVCGCLWL
jgi:hypothetical protein